MAWPTALAWDGALGRAGGEEAGQGSRTDAHVAFARLVREHAAVLHGLARRLAATPADAEDLVQETFLRAWRGLARFRADADIKTWLYRILVNASRDRGRRSRLAARADVRGSPQAPAGPAEVATNRELLGRLFAAVDGLPRRQRECLLLRVRGGLAHRQIADLLGIQEGVVKEHLLRARRTLLDRFGEEVLG